MTRTKPKWLLGMALVTLLVMGWSLAAQAAPPAFTGTGITAPLSSAPEYRQPGATFTVTFDYQSDPDIIPRWTKVLLQLRDGATVIKDLEIQIPSARLDDGNNYPSYTGTASVGMIIPPPPDPGLGEGIYDVRVYLSNSDGMGVVYDSEDDALIVDTTPPTAPGTPSTTSPTNDMTPDWTWGSAMDPAISGGATPGSGMKGYWVKIGTTSGDDDILADFWVGNVLLWTTAPALTPDGTYYLSVRAEDNVSNKGPWATGSVVVDTQLPAAPAVTAPEFTNDTTPTFSWTGASDPPPSSGIAGYTVEIWDTAGSPSKVKGPYTVPHTVDTHSWDLPLANAFAGDGTEDGEYQVRVWTNDAAGNTSTAYGSDT